MYSTAKNVQIVIALLKEHGIKQLVISPGGTNAPFIRGVQNDSFFECYSIVDERSALYFAIGLYLTSGKPVAMCCTSAQATRNYIPGLTEAYYKHVPILAITFSKHPQYVGQDYMQAPNQTSLPVDSVRKSFALPYISNVHDRLHCERLVNEAILELTHRVPAPVQLNVPMLDDELGIDNVPSLPDVKVIKRYTKENFAELKLSGKKVLIVIGENRFIDVPSIEEFARHNNAAIYVNHLSNIFNDYTVEANRLLSWMPQETFDKSYCPDILITIGGQTGDYPLYHKLSQSSNKYEHWRISLNGDVVDTYDHLTKIIESDYESFFNAFLDGQDECSYVSLWKSIISLQTDDFDLPISNAYIAQQLHNEIPDGSIVHFAILNSLRVWNLFPFKNNIKCFSNVGAFGIDGGLSTLIGQSVISDGLCFMVIGDLAFFYDMNSLGIRHIKNNIRIILINNRGGMEFKYGVTNERRKSIDRFIAAADHFPNAEGWAKTCGFTYFSVKEKTEFEIAKTALLKKSSSPVFVEVFTTDELEDAAYSIIRKTDDRRCFKDKVIGRIKREIKKMI